MCRTILLLFLWLLPVIGGCTHLAAPDGAQPTGLSGHLLIIGGGLDDDNKPVYERFIELTRAAASPVDKDSPRILIATAASLNQEPAATGKTESIRAYCPTAKIDAIRRETPTEETVALIDACSAMFFTGGDQKRITDRYRPGGVDTPEAAAMRRLLARGGVIAGTSAGDAMMSDPMFLGGRSAPALGIRTPPGPRAANVPDDPDNPPPQENEPEPPLGPRIGPGMGFLPWAITDSHFFERHRFGRLVAALEKSGHRFGIGVGEDACVEVNLATGDLIGISVADSLLVDNAGARREGLTRRGVRARVIGQGVRESLTGMLARSRVGPDTPMPTTKEEVPVVEPGQNRQLASWRFFTRVQEPNAPALLLKLDGYQQLGWSDGRVGGWSIIEIAPTQP